LTVCSGDADEQVTVEFDVSLDGRVVVIYFEARYDVGECEVEFGVGEAKKSEKGQFTGTIAIAHVGRGARGRKGR
jgi:hypothetical protein